MSELDDAQRDAVEKVAGFVVRTGLTVPAVLWLESVRPLSFVGSQMMHLLTPTMTALAPFPEWVALASLLEEREGLEVLVSRIETLDSEVSDA